jgi:hypothetical protein
MFFTINYPKLRYIDSKISISISKFIAIPTDLLFSEIYYPSRLNFEKNSSKYITGDKINEIGIIVSSR